MEVVDQKPISPLTLIATFTVLSVGYLVCHALYTIFHGRLSHIPGSKVNAITRLQYVRNLIAGTMVDYTVRMHEKYGDVVRLSPYEVSFISAETAFPEIYGFRTGKLKGHVNMQKDKSWYGTQPNGTPSILTANDVDHTRGRKILSHAFSDKALMAQEPLLQDYANQLVNGLKKTINASDDAVNMVKWYNWTTFDIIADLMFGEPFGCLQDLSTHKYVSLLFDSLNGNVVAQIFRYYPWMAWFGNFFVNKDLVASRVKYAGWIASQVAKRTEREPDRPDFMTDILANNGKGSKLTQLEINSNASLIITAGSETTATLLSGVTYLLLKNPDKMAKLKDEVRGAFSTYDDITIDAVNRLPYLLATLSEALRVFPPVPVGFVRATGPGGEVISGTYVPENVSVSVSHYAAYHSEKNFRDADAFVPERWYVLDPFHPEHPPLLDDVRYKDDRKSALQPFSFGPRACLGRNLAYAEMRLIMAKIIWSFDLALEPRSNDWIKRCRVMRLLVKPELAVRLKEVVRA